MSVSPSQPASASTDEPAVISAPAPDYSAQRQQYEEHERMSAMLQQMAELNERVRVISEKYFPHGISMNLECDPELADAYFIVQASVTGTVEEAAALQERWTAELWDQLRESSRFYSLALTFQ